MKEVETPFCDAIKWETMSFEKQHGEKPKALILSYDTAEKLWVEMMPFIIKDESLRFENPKNGFRRFMEMDVIVTSHVYGGSFKWAFGD